MAVFPIGDSAFSCHRELGDIGLVVGGPIVAVGSIGDGKRFVIIDNVSDFVNSKGSFRLNSSELIILRSELGEGDCFLDSSFGHFDLQRDSETASSAR